MERLSSKSVATRPVSPMTFAKLLPWTLILCALALTTFLSSIERGTPAEPAYVPASAARTEAPQFDTQARYERLRAVNEGLERGLLYRLESRER